MPLSTCGLGIGSVLNRHASSFRSTRALYRYKQLKPLSNPLRRNYRLQAQYESQKTLEIKSHNPVLGDGMTPVGWQTQPLYENGTNTEIIKVKAFSQMKPKLRTIGISKRQLKSLRPSPSANLISAIRAIDRNHPALPATVKGKLDLSYVNPENSSLRKVSLDRLAAARGDPKCLADITPRRDLTSVLADYIRSTATDVQSTLQSPEPSHQHSLEIRRLDDQSSALLASKGYGGDDVKLWASIIMAKNVQLAVQMLSDSQTDSATTCPKRVPDFVYLFILRRTDITVDALRTLIEYAWSRFSPDNIEEGGTSLGGHDDLGNIEAGLEMARDYSTPTSSTTPNSNEMTIVLAVIRLLRHARILWPESMTNIVQIITKCLQPFESCKVELRVSRYQRLSFLYNRLLSLLSIPSSIRPFASVTHRQRAQFTLVQRMMKFDPPVLLKREGYRAIITVQAAHKKTSQEIEWADLKSKSWPPWKHERIGLDVEKGPDLGISRSREVIHQLEEAGYPSQSWEHAARIYSGWDTDDSPTIQTRAILKKPSARKSASLKSTNGARSILADTPDIWVARIRSTRTVEEAWACFLALQDSDVPSSEAYYAMLEKLVFGRAERLNKRPSHVSGRIKQASDGNTMLPGDGKEPFPAPISPQEAIYIRSAPPSPMYLFQQMIDQGITPSARCTSFLVSHAESLEQGVMYLQKSRIDPTVSKALINADPSLLATKILTREDLNRMPRLVCTALIKLHCRFSRPISEAGKREKRQRTFNDTSISAASGTARANPFLRGLSLLRLWSPSYRPPWNHALSALASKATILSDLTVDNSEWEQHLSDLLSWRYIQSLVAGMTRLGLEPDNETFRIVCIGFQKAVLASHVVQNLEGSQVLLSAPISTRSSMIFRAERTLSSGARYIRQMFESLVGCSLDVSHDSSAQSTPVSRNLPGKPMLPKILVVPGPAQLHAYVRVLGILDEQQSLLDLIKWINQHSQEIVATAQESKNGKTLMRRTIVAVRVFLEQASTQSDEKEDRSDSSSSTSYPGESLAYQIRHEVDQLEGWGGWPTDDEVENYL